MAAVETRYEHIVLDEQRVPVLIGTNIKVIELDVEQMVYGWSPEELHFQHPRLSLGQIHSALAYYWDHQDVLDRDIERRQTLAAQMQHAAGPSPLRYRLKAQGLL
jgi:uncharacterized protein (DUF433 family)